MKELKEQLRDRHGYSWNDMWNPVKELKGGLTPARTHRPWCVESGEGIESPQGFRVLAGEKFWWNPVKELKVPYPSIFSVLRCAWNPVKELKDSPVASSPVPWRSAWNPEKELKAAGQDEGRGDRSQVESGEGIE